MQKFVTTTRSQSTQWEVIWNRVASHRLWTLVLIAIGAFSSVVYPHPPFVAFGSIAGTTLKPQRAILVALLIWLLNQVYGYTLRQYPWTSDSLLWGLMLGLGTLSVTALAALRPMFGQSSGKGHALWLGVSALLGFLIFEGLILGVDWLLTGGHTLTLAITRGILINATIWTIALALIHLGLIRSMTRSHRPIA